MPSIEQIHQGIQNRIDDFNKDIPKLQNEAFRKVMNTLKDLDTKSGNLQPSIANLKKLRRLKNDLLESILTEAYQKELDQYIASFLETQKLQTNYFSSTFSKFKATDFIDELRIQAIADVGVTLGEIGLEANIIAPIQNIIKINLTSGADFGSLVQQMRSFLTKTESGAGALARYAKTYTTDALNIFAAEYDEAVTEDLGLNWSKYLGAIIGGSREFCRHLVAKKWVHKSEIPKIIKGQIDGKTVSLAGLKSGTTATNFRILRGGWHCQHRLVPISDQAVPEKLRKKFE